MTPRLNFHEAGPDAVKALTALEQQIARSSLEPTLKELIRLRTSQLNGCAFCIDMHATAARSAGESERRLTLLSVWRETTLFTPREMAALEWTEAVTHVAATHVPDDVWVNVRPHFSGAELVDLTLLIGAMNIWNRFAIAFRRLPS
jgi:AhpD family alkylhydroperoxidase